MAHLAGQLILDLSLLGACRVNGHDGPGDVTGPVTGFSRAEMRTRGGVTPLRCHGSWCSGGGEHLECFLLVNVHFGDLDHEVCLSISG